MSCNKRNNWLCQVKRNPRQKTTWCTSEIFRGIPAPVGILDQSFPPSLMHLALSLSLLLQILTAQLRSSGMETSLNPGAVILMTITNLQCKTGAFRRLAKLIHIHSLCTYHPCYGNYFQFLSETGANLAFIFRFEGLQERKIVYNLNLEMISTWNYGQLGKCSCTRALFLNLH